MKITMSALLLILAAASGCGNRSELDLRNRQSSTQSQDSQPAQESERFAAQLDLGDALSGFQLVDAKVGSFDAILSCSGMDDQRITTPVFFVVNGAKDCLLKLESISLNDGRTYVRGGATSYRPPESVSFVSGREQLQVQVVAQLPAVITGPSRVEYRFSQVKVAGEEVVNLSRDTVLITGSKAVSYQLKASRVNASKVELMFECLSRQTGNSLANALCDSDRLSDLVFHAEPIAGSINLSIFDSELLRKLVGGGRSLTIAGGKLIPAGDPSAPNGGFSIEVSLSALSPLYAANSTAGYLLVVTRPASDSFSISRLQVNVQ
jgi:hypothetical protein